MHALDAVVVHGTGSIGQRHLRVLASLGHRAVAMPVRPERREIEGLPGIVLARSWSEARSAMPTARYYSAVIATDTRRHVADACAAIESGYDVLVEKPLAATGESLAVLDRVARERARRVFVACTLRFSRGLAVVRERLDSLGRLYSVRIECQSYLPAWRPSTDHRSGYSARAEDGGVLRDLVHEIDYAVWLFGRPASVFARLENRGELEIASEESADLLWSSASGAMVSLRLDYLARSARRRLLVVGEHGEIEWDAIAGRVTLRPAGEAELSIDVRQERDDMMRDQAVAFLAALRGEVDPRMVSFDDGAFAVRLIDAAHASSRNGASVKIGPGSEA